MKQSRRQRSQLSLPAPAQLQQFPAEPRLPEVEHWSLLDNEQTVAAALKAIDWSFTDAETDYLAHDLHPYPAKFIPQIPAHLIARLSLRGELILDPFSGSGTTALEALRLHRRAIGIDANPIATLIGRTKTSRLDSASRADLHALQAGLKARSAQVRHPAGLLSTHAHCVPLIPNRPKWFSDQVSGELALIRAHINLLENPQAKDVASLALSRIVLRVSFQDSETRYASRPREIPAGETLERFLHEVKFVVARVDETSPELRYGVVNFLTADTRALQDETLKPASVDLIVTSPPYGNANDYHLYHRFRLLWLGYDPKQLAAVEIGSHLRHQRERTGFDRYLDDLQPCVQLMYRSLKPGRYAAIVIGDAVYEGRTYSGVNHLAQLVSKAGFETIVVLDRPLHATKRSFVAPGRRADSEQIMVVRKPPRRFAITLSPPPYRLWPYEVELRHREVAELIAAEPEANPKGNMLRLTVDAFQATTARRLTFSHTIQYEHGASERTWQAVLENGLVGKKGGRKDPKYVTHGLHPYKGKFYPQLAKGLINLAGVAGGATVLDPFCGSGTTLLEAYLNGLRAYGTDLHPLAAKIASAKVGILDVSPDLLTECTSALMEKLANAPLATDLDVDQFPADCIDEISAWFPKPVVSKLNWLLRAIRSVSTGVVRDFLEVVLSSIIRDVSQQEPADLRIRRRQLPLEDADVYGLFSERLRTQLARLEKFWSVRGYSPFRFLAASAICGDARGPATFSGMGIAPDSVDLILTSPPYATALPYIDTDRLSLLVLFGMPSSVRRPLELSLTGSREISPLDRSRFEKQLIDQTAHLPAEIQHFVAQLHFKISHAKVGFRRRNLPSLLTRFFLDMRAALANCRSVLKRNGDMFVVIGDNKTVVTHDAERIPTTDLMRVLAESVDLRFAAALPITVTTENLIHAKHAITQNAVLRFRG